MQTSNTSTHPHTNIQTYKRFDGAEERRSRKQHKTLDNKRINKTNFYTK